FLVARLPRHDLRFRVRTEDVVGRHIYKYHVHEAELTALLARQLTFEAGDVIVDVGANIGWYSVLLDRLAPNGVDILAFEPDPLNFRLLTENLRLNGARSVLAVRKALADREGVMRLHLHDSSNLGRHSLLELQDGASVDVETTTLHRYWAQQGLGERTPRFIKIDIEGYELQALRGAGDLLARCPAVLCEYSPEYMRRGGMDPADLVDLFVGHGFIAHRVSARGLEPMTPDAVKRLEPITDLFWRSPAGAGAAGTGMSRA
ncbi:MAG: FkbM family methyltransferase, partial [Gammaproteobacteria bacterium]